jgi:hypothetical protein
MQLWLKSTSVSADRVPTVSGMSPILLRANSRCLRSVRHPSSLENAVKEVSDKSSFVGAANALVACGRLEGRFLSNLRSRRSSRAVIPASSLVRSSMGSRAVCSYSKRTIQVYSKCKRSALYSPVATRCTVQPQLHLVVGHSDLEAGVTSSRMTTNLTGT